MNNQWIRAKCSTSACVEVNSGGSIVGVRSSNDPENVVIFTHEEWTTFLDGVKAGDFDGTTR